MISGSLPKSELNQDPHHIRKTFLNFFARHGHEIVPSSSLIPHDDPTLLFTNAGMNQFKNVFLGIEKRPYRRAVSSQKCVRAGGKHNDLDNVGFTSRHHTFFEMLGNFSFGDYFKVEAIEFAWTLLTTEFAIPCERLSVTVFKDDWEAAQIWKNHIGISSDRICFFDEKDNFWRMGDTGPCGPCTEIYYDHGPQFGTYRNIQEGIISGGERYVEIWNLVFMQFDEQEPGKLIPLPSPSVDTGSGLERLTAVLQNTHHNYRTTLFLPLIAFAAQKLGVDWEALHHWELELIGNPKGKETRKNELEKLSALRVLADHIRAASFLIADHALPSNEGRGYVLRRIIRRALRYAHKLNPEVSVFPEMSGVLVQLMGSAYPELNQALPTIKSVLEEEEQKFSHTLEQGTHLLVSECEKLRSYQKNIISGELAFRLYDTYGFPLDLTEIIAREQGFQVDTTGFYQELERSRERSKTTWKGKALSGQDKAIGEWALSLQEKHGPTEFVGYQKLQCRSLIIGSYPIDQENVAVVTQKTPFYALGGGQQCDHGYLIYNEHRYPIVQVEKRGEILVHWVQINATNGSQTNPEHSHSSPLEHDHECVLKGEVDLVVDTERRHQIAKNHSATHLLHAALRKILGKHVTQAGSDVGPVRLRFDFTHPKALTPNEIKAIQEEVNQQISKSMATQVEHMSLAQAQKKGALAFFQEKYGDEVRVLSIGSDSVELCGGTHVGNTSEIGIFVIVSEGSVSQGVRRIEALTGLTAWQYLESCRQHYWEALRYTGQSASSWESLLERYQQFPNWVTPSPLIAYLEKQKRSLKELTKKETDLLRSSQVDTTTWLNEAIAVNADTSSSPLWLLVKHVPRLDHQGLMALSDQLKKAAQKPMVYLLQSDELALLGTAQCPHVHAGQVFKEITKKWGGQGGGRADLAQGKLPPIELQEFREWLSHMLHQKQK
ncbi:MAG: alanine--tRNA ligase [Bdellovibrionaceae bacterium]|nr:alanine--tRNA ligase [Pseudobdellovibrionaceae bacterium]MDW8190169.1 alanine--tRNA ligase [Pseudobdellovibrionaceae bacterium]